MGVTGAQAVVDPAALEAAVRDVLNVTAPRVMAVLSPVRVTISNYSADCPRTVKVPNFPSELEKGYHDITFDDTIYIEASDFKENEEKGFRRFTPNQSVGLKHAGLVITLQSVEKDVSGNITNLIVKQEVVSESNKPKAFIHWVAKPALASVRLYEPLFKHKNPEDPNEVPNGFLTDINPLSKKEVVGYIDAGLSGNVKPFTQYQFERIGFFSIDPDSKPGKLVFNRTVTLKEDSSKV